MYQIDNAFTCLQPAIDFSDVTAKPDADTSCVIGSPPPRLAAVHNPALVNDWHRRLTQAVAQPTQTEKRKGRRRVQVLGNAIFDFDGKGEVHAYRWSFNELGLPALVQMPDHTVVAQGVPYQSLWMNGYAAGALRTLQAMHPGQTDECRAYAAWASAELASRCWTNEIQHRARPLITQALALDPQILNIANQIQLTARALVPIRLQEYNHVLSDRTRYLSVAQEAPQLLALYALLATELEPVGEVTQQMKTLLEKHGISPAMWRLLTRDGSQWMNDYLPYFDFERQSAAFTAIEILQMVQAFGTAHLVPDYLMHALIQLGGNPNFPSARFVSRLNDQFPLCARLGHLATTSDASALAILQEHANAIFQWGSDYLSAVPKQTLRRASLAWLIRTVQAQTLLDKKQREGGQRWAVPTWIYLACSQVSAVILDSPLAVWQEGQTMRHCADNYVNRCASGELLMVSLRHQHHRHPMATVAFSMNGESVSVYKYSGFANQMVSPQVRDLIDICCRQLQPLRRSVSADQPVAKAVS